jgi:hypothetical protein
MGRHRRHYKRQKRGFSRESIEIFLLLYLPLILCFAMALGGALLHRLGYMPVSENVWGPLCVMVAGWCFTGGLVVGFRHGAVPILEGEYGRFSAVLRWGVIVCYGLFSLSLILGGLWLLLRALAAE